MLKRSASARRSAPRPTRATKIRKPFSNTSTRKHSTFHSSPLSPETSAANFSTVTLSQETKVAEAEREREAQRAAAPTGDKEKEAYFEHLYVSGETLQGLALRYGVTVRPPPQKKEVFRN